MKSECTIGEVSMLTLYFINLSGMLSTFQHTLYAHLISLSLALGKVFHWFACIQVRVNEGWMIQDHIAKVPYKGTVQY